MVEHPRCSQIIRNSHRTLFVHNVNYTILLIIVLATAVVYLFARFRCINTFNSNQSTNCLSESFNWYDIC